MAAVRPVVSIFSAEDAKPVKTAAAPGVFASGLRPDLVAFTSNLIAMNKRQPYAVSKNAGYQTAAESWGTGRAVARIPRVPGGGTHRAGQAAFGNQCRGGGMFNPTKVWRKWHRKVNITQKRHAICSAISATGIPALVMARGHRVDEVPELPLVVSNEAQALTKTRDAKALLDRLGCTADLDKVIASRSIRAGKGKMRNRRYVQRKGPLVIYGKDEGISKAFRNIPGVDTLHVERLNLLKLAPGGHLGRLTVYTEDAFNKLKQLYGSPSEGAKLKKGYHMPRAIMTNADLDRIINSDEIQSVLRPMRVGTAKSTLKKNPLKNKQEMMRLNPGSGHRAYKAKQGHTANTNERKIVVKKSEKLTKAKKAHATKSKAWFKAQMDAYIPKAAPAEEEADSE